jgi:hypothetical protein
LVNADTTLKRNAENFPPNFFHKTVKETFFKSTQKLQLASLSLSFFGGKFGNKMEVELPALPSNRNRRCSTRRSMSKKGHCVVKKGFVDLKNCFYVVIYLVLGEDQPYYMST